MRKRIIILSLLIYGGYFYPQQSSLSFQKISINEGLSQSTVECILQDKSGLMWFGTNDGLNKYDGYDFTIYRYEPLDKNSISDNYIYSIVEDHSGHLWIGTNNGLNRYDPVLNKFTRYLNDPQNPSSISHNLIHNVSIDETGNIYAASLGGGLNILLKDSDRFIRIKSGDSFNHFLASDLITSVFADNKNRLWIGSYFGHIQTADISAINAGSIDGINFQTIKIDNRTQAESSENIIWQVYQDKNDFIWISTNREGAIKIDPADYSQTYFTPNENKNRISDFSVHRVFEDSRGYIWIGTESGGLDIIIPGQTEILNHRNDPNNPYDINDNSIWSLYEDKTGIIWIGTEFGGLNKVIPSRLKFEHYFNIHNQNSINNNRIWAICETPDGNLLIGTEDGLNFFNPHSKTFEVFKHNPKIESSISSSIIATIIKDDQDDIWVGTNGGGINKFNILSRNFIRYLHNPADPTSISNNNIKSMFKSANGKLWIGTYGGGVCLFDPLTGKAEKPAFDNHEFFNEADFAFSLYEEKDILWIGTYGNGLIKYDYVNKKYKIYRHSENDIYSIPNNKIYSIHKDNNGNLWIGTTGGLAKYIEAEDSFETFSIKEGLPNNVIYSILEDDNGYLWISTNKGLSRFDPENKIFKNFTLKDGIQSYEFNRGAAIKTNDGLMLFGGVNGFNIFRPSEINLNTFAPRIVFTSFKKKNVEAYLGRSINYSENIELSYNDNFFSIGFSALDYTDPDANYYAYMMEGFDDDWIYAGNIRGATYTHLDPGEYTFKVKAANNDGVWNEQGASIGIIINPPYWLTWWFRGFILLIISSILYAVYRYRLNRALEIERLRIKIASDLHDDIGSDLTRIAIQSELILENINKENFKNAIIDIGQRSRDLITVMGDVVWSIDARNDTAENLLDRMKEFSASLLEPKNIYLSFEQQGISGEKNLPIEVRQNIYLIFKEAVNNIAKHSDASEVKIFVKNLADKFEMKIYDNGNLKDSQKRTGHGLKNMQMRSERIGGNIKINNENGMEIIFTGKPL